jgi:hypothetical protein
MPEAIFIYAFVIVKEVDLVFASSIVPLEVARPLAIIIIEGSCIKGCNQWQRLPAQSSSSRPFRA